jgi:very-short-patch-repair endonuclease
MRSSTPGQAAQARLCLAEDKVAAEYDSDEWHAGAEALRRDRNKLAALQDLGWTVVPVIADDVRRRPQALVARIRAHLDRTAAA